MGTLQAKPGDINAMIFGGCSSGDPRELVAWMARADLSYAAGKAQQGLGHDHVYTNCEEVGCFELLAEMKDADEEATQEVAEWLRDEGWRPALDQAEADAEEAREAAGLPEPPASDPAEVARKAAAAQELARVQADLAPRLVPLLRRLTEARAEQDAARSALDRILRPGLPRFTPDPSLVMDLAALAQGQPAWAADLVRQAPTLGPDFEFGGPAARARYRAWEKALTILRHEGLSEANRSLYESTVDHGPGAGRYALFDDFSPVGRVYDARLFFALAAVKRLHALLAEPALAPTGP